MKSISLTNKSIVIILIVFTFLAYANSLFNSFVWDDYLVIVENNFIKSWKNFPLIFTRSYLTSASKIDYLGLNRLDAGEISYRPLVTASYFMDYSIWKLNPLGYHFTNIILHIFNVLLFYLFLSLLIKDRKSSLLASLFFALHPVNIEAVNCIAFREDLLAFLFFILSLILFVRFSSCESRKKIYFYVASLISYSLALFSKEMAITLPLVLILYDYYFVYKNDIKKIIADFKARYLAYIAVSLVYLWVLFFGMANKLREFPQYPGGSFYVNILTMSKVIAIYIK